MMRELKEEKKNLSMFLGINCIANNFYHCRLRNFWNGMFKNKEILYFIYELIFHIKRN